MRKSMKQPLQIHADVRGPKNYMIRKIKNVITLNTSKNKLQLSL
jgi:hypothetical protein